MLHNVFRLPTVAGMLNADFSPHANVLPEFDTYKHSPAFGVFARAFIKAQTRITLEYHKCYRDPNLVDAPLQKVAHRKN